MIRYVKILILVSIIASLTGCASIVGGSGPQAIPVTTEPTESKLEIKDLKTGQQVLTATTPYTVMLNRSSGYFSKSSYEITVSKDGYIPQKHVIAPRLSGWYIGGNILFGGLVGWLIVDPATGAMYTFDEKTLYYSLYADNEIGRAALKAEEERKKKEEDAKKSASTNTEKAP